MYKLLGEGIGENGAGDLCGATRRSLSSLSRSMPPPDRFVSLSLSLFSLSLSLSLSIPPDTATAHRAEK